MWPKERPAFVALLTRAFRFAGKDITTEPELIADWLDEFAAYPLAALDDAFRRHRRTSPYPPKPADLYRRLEGADAKDGRPTGDEAWGLLLRLIRDERETGVLSDEMRTAWGLCDPILKAGDEVGARRCFLDAYARAVNAAREQHQAPHWNVTLGTDPTLRPQRLHAAVAAGRLTADHARALLPGPTPATISQVAGLLEGPDASAEELRTAERLRALAQLLKANSAEQEQRRAEQRQRQREAEEARRQELLQQLAQREHRATDRKHAT